MIIVVHCISLGPQPVGIGVQFLTGWVSRRFGLALVSWLPPVLVSIAFPHSPSISLCLSLTFLPLPLHFIRVSSLRPMYLHPLGRPVSYSLFIGEFPGLGLALVPDIVFSEAKQRCAWSRNLVSNFCPDRGVNLEPCSLKAANVTTRLRRTTKLMK